MNTIRHAYNSDSYSEEMHELLELIRLLDSRHYFESAHQAKVISDTKAQFNNQDGTPFDKLIAYAKTLDQDGDLSSALTSARTPFALFAKAWVVGYFVLGVVSAYGLLYGHFVNFFYLFIVLLGWHSISLLIWLVRPKHHANFSIAWRQFSKLSQKLNTKDILTQSAYDTILATNQAKHPWQMMALTHKAWIFALLGNIVGLLMLFLSKNYTFTWESTLLTQAHITKLIEIIAIVPSWFGLDLSPITHTNIGFASDKLAILLMASIAIYGILPRLFALLYCQIQIKRRAFAIDGRLYFFENLLRQFNQTIIDPNDHQPIAPKPAQAKISTNKKIVASLEFTPKDSFWYQFGTGADVIEIGTLDEKVDFARLKQAVDEHRLSVYLGVGVHLLPDRGIVRKLSLVKQIAQFGLVVELLSDHPPANRHEFYGQWQQILTQLGIDEVRYT